MKDQGNDAEKRLVDDHALMACVARGESCAFEELTERHLKSMVRVAQRILGNAAEADETVQEAFLRLWRYAPRWDPNGTGSVRAWLSRVVSNLCVDRCRRRRSIPLQDIDEIEDPAPNAFGGLCAEDHRKIVGQLLSALPERQKLAVVLSYLEDMSGREVAATMGLSEGAVESLLVRARKTLRETLKKSGLIWGVDL